MSELFISDAEFNSAYNSYTEKVDEIETALQVYLDCIKSIVCDNNLQGRTAGVLLEFAEMVEDSIKGELGDIIFRFRVITGRFLDDIATQDDVEF